MTSARSAPALLDAHRVLTTPTLSLLRDDTDAADAIPLLFHLTRSLHAPTPSPTKSSSPIVIVTTRSRSIFPSATSHIYPHVSRAMRTVLSTYISIDPHNHFNPSQLLPVATATARFVNLVTATVSKVQARVILIECLHALRYTFDVDPAAAVRSLLSHNTGLSVVAVAPVVPDLRLDLTNLSQLAENVIDLRDLRTGTAPDVDGLITVTKRDGKWTQSEQQRRYKITDNNFTIYM